LENIISYNEKYLPQQVPKGNEHSFREDLAEKKTTDPHILYKRNAMTKIYLSIILVLTTMLSFAQVVSKQNDLATGQNTHAFTYRLFPTQNIWTFIKLNTRNGQIWQIQFGMEKENRVVINLHAEPLVSKDKEVNDRFTLYPTQNMYTFILLDQIDGKTWQMQWSTDPNNRGIMPIE